MDTRSKERTISDETKVESKSDPNLYYNEFLKGSLPTKPFPTSLKNSKLSDENPKVKVNMKSRVERIEFHPHCPGGYDGGCDSDCHEEIYDPSGQAHNHLPIPEIRCNSDCHPEIYKLDEIVKGGVSAGLHQYHNHVQNKPHTSYCHFFKIKDAKPIQVEIQPMIKSSDEPASSSVSHACFTKVFFR